MDSPTSTTSRLSAFIVMGVGLLIGLLAGLVVFVGLPEWWPGQAGNPEGAPAAAGTSAPAPVVGAPAPDFALQDLAGNEVRLSDLRGQVVLINFWATWCGPCRLEMPAMQAKYDALKDQGFTVLAVNLDEPVDDVSAFAESLGLTFTVLLDPGAEVNDLYRVRGYPTSFFVNREGMVDRQHVGIMSEGQLDDYLAKLGLAE